MADTSLFYWNDQIAKVSTRSLIVQFAISAAKTSSPVIANSFVLTSYDVISAQSTIDTFLGTTNEFLKIAFDATAMGTDAFACIFNMNGQCKQLVTAKARTYSGSNGATIVSEGVLSTAAGLTASSLTTEAALGASGNVAVRAILAGLDALTSGIIEIQIDWISK